MVQLEWIVVVACAVAGAGCGAGVRALLRRAVALPAGCCEPLLAGIWAVTGWAWVSGTLSGRLVPLLFGLGGLAATAGPVDVRHRRLPDVLTLPALPAGLLLLVPLGAAAPARGLAGAVAGVLVYGTVHLLGPGSLGAGDVKLAGALGAATGGVGWAIAVLAALLAGAGTALAALILRRRVLPHGPAMLAAAWTVVAGCGVSGAPLGAAGGG